VQSYQHAESLQNALPMNYAFMCVRNMILLQIIALAVLDVGNYASAQTVSDRMDGVRRVPFMFSGDRKVLFSLPYQCFVIDVPRSDFPPVSNIMWDISLNSASIHSGISELSRRSLDYSPPLRLPLSSTSVFNTSEESTLKQLSAAFLHQLLGFGYQYAREWSRKPSLTEFDYLELPQGTGVLRSFREVETEALRRSEIQSIKIHDNLREEQKTGQLE